MLGSWLFFFPESPKFLIECGETAAAMEILKDMYKENTGRERSEYPVKLNENMFHFTKCSAFGNGLISDSHEFRFPLARSKVYVNVRASAPYRDVRVNRCERLVFGNRKK